MTDSRRDCRSPEPHAACSSRRNLRSLAKARLVRARSVDPSLADRFFRGAGQQAGSAAGGEGGSNAGANEFAQALQRLSILSTPSEESKTEEMAARSVGVSGMGVCFEPVTSGPSDPAYRQGIGGQLQLIVTKQVELACTLELRRDGTVIMPQVGQISLAGLTLDPARTVLKARIDRSYRGLNNGEAHLDLFISGIRSNAVFVIGEVESLGAYQVKALATVPRARARRWPDRSRIIPQHRGAPRRQGRPTARSLRLSPVWRRLGRYSDRAGRSNLCAAQHTSRRGDRPGPAPANFRAAPQTKDSKTCSPLRAACFPLHL